MCAHHTLYSELPKDLGFLCSFYIDIPYYKDELHSNDPQQKALYSAKDSVVTREIAVVLTETLKRENLLTFYYTYIHSILPELMNMQLKGVKIDLAEQTRLRNFYTCEAKAALADITAFAGREINLASPKQIAQFLYGNEPGDLHLPPIYKRGSRKTKVTTDEEAIIKLFQKTNNATLKRIIDYRHNSKMLSTYVNAPTRDDRIHTSYNVAASTKPKKSGIGYEVVKSAPVSGRLSSSSDIFGYGTNLQNFPEEVRGMCIPDIGYEFTSVDLSQAEAMVIAYLAGDVKLIKMFEEGKKVHQYIASMVFNKSYAEVGKGTKEYDLGKRLVHGTNYGMEEGTFSIYAGTTIEKARFLLNKYFRTFPSLKRYQTNLKNEIKYSKVPKITTPTGRRRIFLDRKGPKLNNQILSFSPQSTIADVLNLSGIVKLPFLIRKEKIDAQVLLQIHDEVVIQNLFSERNRLYSVIAEAFNTPLKIEGRVCIIPYEIQHGKSWKELK